MFSIWKRYLVFISVFFISVSSGVPMLHAEDKYPERNIELNIPWGAGGIADVTGRIFADELSKILKVAVTPVNKPGATGTLGAAMVAGARKDGYTLMVNTISGMTLSHFTLPDVPYDTLKDFTPISTIAVSPNIIVVKADSPLKSFEDLIKEAARNPEKLTYATAGVGSECHFNMEQLQAAANIKLTHIPYKSGGEALTATLGGHADFGVSVVGSVASQLKAGTIRGLVISGNKRISAFPAIPTFAEKGYPQHFFGNWAGFFAPAGIPRSVLDVLSSATEKTTKSSEFKSRVEKIGSEPLYMSPTDFRTFLGNDRKTAEVLAKKIASLLKK